MTPRPAALANRRARAYNAPVSRQCSRRPGRRDSPVGSQDAAQVTEAAMPMQRLRAKGRELRVVVRAVWGNLVLLNAAHVANLMDVSAKENVHFFCPYDQAADHLAEDLLARAV